MGLFTHAALVQAHLFGNTSLHFRAARIKRPVIFSLARFAVCDTLDFIVIHNRPHRPFQSRFSSLSSSSHRASLVVPVPHAPARPYCDQHMMSTQMTPAITKTVPHRSLQEDRRSPSQYVLRRLSFMMTARRTHGLETLCTNLPETGNHQCQLRCSFRKFRCLCGIRH